MICNPPITNEPDLIAGDCKSPEHKEVGTFFKRRIANPSKRLTGYSCLPSGVPADLQSAVKKGSTYETGGFIIPHNFPHQ